MMRYIAITKIILRNAYIRDSKIMGFVFSNLLFQIVEMVANITFFNILFANTSSIGGWNFYQILFLYMYSRSIFGIYKAFFRGGFTMISNVFIRQGDYDFYLTKPVSSLILASLNKPRIYEFIAVVFQVSIGIWAIIKGNIAIGYMNLIWFLFLTVLSIALLYSLTVITITPVFWLVRVWALREIIPRLQQFMRYPIGIFPGFLKIILMGIFPIMATSFIPVSILLYPPKISYIIYMVIITIVFILIARTVWRLGERCYGSASS